MCPLLFFAHWIHTFFLYTTPPIIPVLLLIKKDYLSAKRLKSKWPEFVTKRCNLPERNEEETVATWEQILKCCYINVEKKIERIERGDARKAIFSISAPGLFPSFVFASDVLYFSSEPVCLFVISSYDGTRKWKRWIYCAACKFLSNAIVRNKKISCRNCGKCGRPRIAFYLRLSYPDFSLHILNIPQFLYIQSFIHNHIVSVSKICLCLRIYVQRWCADFFEFFYYDGSVAGFLKFKSFKIFNIAAVIFGRFVTDSLAFSTSIPLSEWQRSKFQSRWLSSWWRRGKHQISTKT